MKNMNKCCYIQVDLSKYKYMHINVHHRWWLWNELVALRSSHEKRWHSRLFSRDCWNIRTVAVSSLSVVKVSFAGYLQPKHPATEDILANLGIVIYSKISGRCMTRTCSWTCFWQGNCIVKCLVPTSRQQRLHILNPCVESSSFKWNLNHLSMSSLLTCYKLPMEFSLCGAGTALWIHP